MRYLLIVLFFMPGISISQKIIESEFDKFTKQTRIKTSSEALKGKLNEGLSVYIRSVDSTTYIILSGYGRAADVIGSNDQAIFLFLNDSTVTVTSTGVQSYDIGKYNNSYRHQYSISLSDIESLARNDLKAIRKYGADGYVDIEIPEKNKGDLKKLAQLFIAEFSKKI